MRIIFDAYDEDSSGEIDEIEMRRMLSSTLTIESKAPPRCPRAPQLPRRLPRSARIPRVSRAGSAPQPCACLPSAAERKGCHDRAHHRAGAHGDRHGRQRNHNLRGTASHAVGSPRMLACVPAATMPQQRCGSHQFLTAGAPRTTYRQELQQAFRARPQLLSEYFGQNIIGCESLY